MASQPEKDVGSTDKGTAQANPAVAAASGTATGETQRPITVSSEGGRERGSALRPITGRFPDLFGGALTLSPFELIRRMSEEMNQLVENLGFARGGVSPQARGRRRDAFDFGATGALWIPQVELQQRPNELLVRADLPGLEPGDVEVRVDDGLLTISGERKQERREGGDGSVHTEVSYGAFTRVIPLPDGAVEDKIAASFKNGVLEIDVPLSDVKRGRRVEVKA